MALSPPISLGLFPPHPSTAVASPSSISIHVLRAGGYLPEACSTSQRLRASGSSSAPHLPREESSEGEPRSTSRTSRRKKMPRSSFYEQTTKRWSARITSQRSRFPWQEKKGEDDGKEDEEEETVQSALNVRCPPFTVVSEDRSRTVEKTPSYSSGNPVVSAPWSRRSESRGFASERIATLSLTNSEIELDGETGEPRSSLPIVTTEDTGSLTYGSSEAGAQIPWGRHGEREGRRNLMISSVLETLKSSYEEGSSDMDEKSDDGGMSGSVGVNSNSPFPWERDGADRDKSILHRRSNTELAERTIPEPELRRLRNLALRIKERTKVGSAGVTQDLVGGIQRKWKEVEVVKLKFEGSPSLHMKRTHETLEMKTGGIVIWRSGSSLVLYRGISYGLPCTQSYLSHSLKKCEPEDSNIKDSDSAQLSSSNGITSLSSSDHLIEGSKLNIENLLDELGPRFRDWSGWNPPPVDADLLPAIVPDYKPPLRLLPYKIKLGLRNREMTYLRRLARTMPPHFALGRNRMLQGLARAIVKLWEKSIIAKIAIKRGVQNTCNERMAEEIKKLTGGVLLSRNKEYIVLYRGNDFLVPSLLEVLSERQNSVNVRQDEEEQARLHASASVTSTPTVSKGPHLAGTLAETLKAKTYWRNELSDKERERVMNELALKRHAAHIKFMEKKLALARQKVHKAEKALAKVQKFLSPAELPNDLETVTDEERFLYRKIGLKMKAFLSLGRRGVFDGSVENMHLSWKHRELVKIIVKDKSFSQVKHIAISLEAESGGILISLDKTTKGYAIIVYRGKNYHRPPVIKPKNLLTKRQALARSIELQRHEALNHHISDLREKIETLKSELERMKNIGGGNDVYSHMDDNFLSDDDVEDDGEEAYLETYNSSNEDDDAPV